jgi:ABC-type sugar transport system ATPase subunit
MTAVSALLSVQALEKSFGHTVAISGVSFDIYADTVVALAGGNASGKTTLLKVIAGAITPDAGHVEWEGNKLQLGNPYRTRLAGIEMVFQDNALCPDCSVLENLFLGREHSSALGFLAIRKMQRLAREMVERYGFPIPSLDVTPSQLSGGQQKAVAIGRALLSTPRLLLLDEPTAALGVREQNTVLRTLAELKTAGVGILFCTHSPDEILSVADRLLVMKRGKLSHDTNPKNVSRADLTALMSP